MTSEQKNEVKGLARAYVLAVKKQHDAFLNGKDAPEDMTFIEKQVESLGDGAVALFEAEIEKVFSLLDSIDLNNYHTKHKREKEMETTVLDGAVDTYPEIVEVLECHGYDVGIGDDCVFMAIEGELDTYMAEMHITEDGDLLFNCEVGKMGDFGPDDAQNALAFLYANSQINPFAVTILPPEDLEEPEVSQLVIVLTDKIPMADMDPSELVAAVESLLEAVQIIEEMKEELFA